VNDSRSYPRRREESVTDVQTEAPGGKELILVADAVLAPVKDLKPYPKNPRKGNLKGIVESLRKGQYRALVVNKRNMEVLAGNHTLLAAKELKWKNIAVGYVDVDDKEAARIVLADNRLNDMASYDTTILADVLKNIPSVVGTGYDDADVRAILAAVEDKDETLLIDSIRPPVQITFEPEDEDYEPPTFDQRLEDLKDRVEARQGEDEDLMQVSGGDDLDNGLAELQGALELKEDMQFEIDHNYWGIPQLRRDMLVETLPDPIDTWGGKDATPDDGTTTWVYNYGAANGSGLPWDRAILSFFTYDHKFENWWDLPAYMTAKALNKGCKMAIVPDFSFWTDEPRALHLYNAYRAQWLGRYFQEAGIKVIPRIMWTDVESIKYSLLGIPKKPPVAAVCIQAIDKKEMTKQMSADGLREIIKELQPDTLLVYAGNPGQEMVKSAFLPKTTRVVYIDNYAAKRRGVVFDNPDGKKGAAKAKRFAEKKTPKDAVIRAKAKAEEANDQDADL
jgi:hypothetical protein